MKNMKRNVQNEIKVGSTKKIQKIAIKMGESFLDGRFCIGFVYEPKVPQKLLEKIEK